MLVVFSAAAPLMVNATTANGKCGVNVTWTLNDEGTLTISGTGEMQDYNDYYLVPWRNYRFDIKNVVVGDGVTSIGDVAFFECSSLTSVTIPDSVTSIGDSAFQYCSSLESINISDSLSKIPDSCFSGCSKLTNITLPNRLTSIGDSAFFECSSLIEITIPSKIERIN